jgi:hypothetical protein
MHRVLLTAAAALLVAACSAPPRFQDLRTPSGEFCTDMPVIPAGQAPDREYHRLGPIQSDPHARTEAERLESLRKAACASGGDAVIEAVNEEVRLPDATYGMVSSGYAIIWTRRPGSEVKPLQLHPTNGGGAAASEEGGGEAQAQPTAAPEEPAAPTPTATPTTTAKATPAPTGSAKAGAAPTTTKPGTTTTTKKAPK